MADKDVNAGETKKYIIQATNYPIYYFTQRIVDKKMEVKSFIPLGVEPHSWEPTPGDIVKLEKSNILLYNGAGMEHWITDIAKSVKKEIKIVNTSAGINLLQLTDYRDAHGKHEEDQEEGQYDPHVWLDPVNAQIMAKNIKEILVEIDPVNASHYEENYTKLVKELDQLDQAFKQGLKDISQREFIVNHASFGYLAHRYDLKQAPIMAVSPYSEPTPKKMLEIIELTKEHGINYVFTEVLVSSRVAEVLAKEAGVKTAVLNPLANITKRDIEDGKNYFSIMYTNLEVLKMALK